MSLTTLGGVIVAVVHQRNAFILVHGRIQQAEFPAARGVGLHSDAKDLALHAGLDLAEIIGLGQDGVDGVAVALPGPIRSPGTSLKPSPVQMFMTQTSFSCLGQILADPDAGAAVLDPEAAGLSLGLGEGQGGRTCHGRRRWG